MIEKASETVLPTTIRLLEKTTIRLLEKSTKMLQSLIAMIFCITMYLHKRGHRLNSDGNQSLKD